MYRVCITILYCFVIHHHSFLVIDEQYFLLQEIINIFINLVLLPGITFQFMPIKHS